MTVLHLLPCNPDREAMASFVHALFRASGMRGKVELAWTSPHHPHPVSGARLFDLADLDELVDFALQINEAPNRNVYIGPGLRRESCPHDRRTKDEDTISSVAVWADCDGEGLLMAALDVAERIHLPPNMVIFTGRTPHLRGQLWWLLDEPCDDLETIRSINSALVAKLGTDYNVVNVGRVMRLAGSVAWPIKKGRTMEMTGFFESETRQTPYTIDEIKSTLLRAGAMPTPAKTADIIPFSGVDLNTAEPTYDLDQLIAGAGQAGQWHRHALLAVAHLTARGAPPDLVLDILTSRLQQPGYSYADTRNELVVMLRGALARGFAPSESTPAPDPQTRGRDPFPLIPLSEIGLREPPGWRVQGYIPERGFGIVYGASGTYKSFVALDMALSIAHGLPWRGQETSAAPVVYLAGEGGHGLQNRIAVWRQHRAGAGTCRGFWLAPVAASLLDKQMVMLVAQRLRDLPQPPRLLLVDTLARSFGPGDENSSQDMNMFVAACDYLANAIDGFVLAIHHTGKDSERGARGSSVLRAACDIEFEVKKASDDIVSVRCTKMKDAEAPHDVAFRMVRAESAHPATGEVVTSLIPVALDTPEAAENGQSESASTVPRFGKNERMILSKLDDGPQSFATLRSRTGLDNGTLGRSLRALKGKNMILERDGVYLWRNATSGVSESEENQ